MSILKNQNLWLYITFAFTLFFIASSINFHVFEFNTLPSQFFGALIGTVLTIIITALLLHGQSASEVQRDKDIKIFEHKIEVYSEFTEKMW